MHIVLMALAVAALDGGDEAAPEPPASVVAEPFAGDAGSEFPQALAGVEADAGDLPVLVQPMPQAPLVPASGDFERVVPQQDFVKGELSVFLGSDRLTTKRNRIGISVGLNQIGSTFYALVDPQFDIRLLDRKLAIGVGVPLNFEILDLNDPSLTQNSGRFRKEDWALPSDFARVLSYLTYGHKEDNLYINVGQVYASSIGHGAIVRRYAPDIDPNLTRVSAQVDAYNDYAGFEALTNDVVQWNLLSALGFVKPLSWLGDNLLTKTLSVGATVATDLTAPRELMTDDAGARLLDANNRLRSTNGAVVLGGLDMEVKVVKTANVDIKPYLDYSRLFGGDGGWTLGALGRFNYPQGTLVHAFRVVAELRYMGARYSPSYFDTFYEVERYQAAQGPTLHRGFINYLTKYQYVMGGLTQDGSALPATRGGFYLEASYGIRNKVGVTFAIDGDTAVNQRNFVAHIEVPWLNFFQFFASYYKRGFSDFSQLAKVDEQSIFFAGARLRTLPFLFFNARAYKTFTVNAAAQRYDNIFGFVLDAELGWEFWTHEQEVQDGLKELQSSPSPQGNVPR